jgi:hypothetical protein
MTAISNDELIAKRRRIIASMTREEQRDRLNQVAERTEKRLNDEYIRQQVELHKQSDQYKERIKRKQLEQANETKTAEKQEQ